MKNCVIVFTNYRENILNLKGKPTTGLLLLPSLGIDSIYTNWKLEHRDWNFGILDAVINNYTKKETLKLLLETEPDVAAFSTSFLNLQDAKWIAEGVKREYPESITVLGGLGARSMAVLTKEGVVEDVDVCVLGDGEPAFKFIRNYKALGRMVCINRRIEDLNELHFPSRECFNVERYIEINQRYSPIGRHGRVLNIYTSKGCNWGKCIFCTAERGCRSRSLENIREEINHLMENYSPNHLILCDDDFISRSDVPQVSHLLGEYGFKWTVEMRINAVTGEKASSLLQTMGENGCVQILWGAESGDTQTLRTLKKGMTPKAVIKAISMAAKAGIRSTLSFMYNTPKESKESISNTTSLIKQIIHDYSDQLNSILFFEYASIPGSVGWAEGLKKGDVPEETIHSIIAELSEICKQMGIPFIPQRFADSPSKDKRKTA